MVFPIFAEVSFLQIVIATLLLTHITIISVTVFLHRHQAHGSVTLHPAVSHFFRFWLWLTTGIVTKEWVAIHRKHHSTCETPKDPHSPIISGIWTVLFGGYFLYYQESKDDRTIKTYGSGTPSDFLEKNIYSRWASAGILLLLVGELVLFGFAGLVMWTLQMIWIPFWAAGVINGVGHYWGYRNFETPDASSNIIPWGIIVGGEELHNNHHAFPASPKLSVKWWEFDIGWSYIRLLKILGLANVREDALRPVVSFRNPIIPVADMKLLLSNRLRTMTQFGKEVMIPILREEMRKADKNRRMWLKNISKTISRDELSLPDDIRQAIQSLLNSQSNMKTAHEFKLKLGDVWKNPPSPHELRQRLVHWCKEAEQSGVKALEEFAIRLRVRI